MLDSMKNTILCGTIIAAYGTLGACSKKTDLHTDQLETVSAASVALHSAAFCL